MASAPAIKICGINEVVALEVALKAGADFIGLVFYPPSPRAVTVELAKELATIAGRRLERVGLFVNPALDDVARVLDEVPLDMIQLHGDESPYFIKDLKEKTILPVIKAIPVSGPEDLVRAHYYQEYADWLLFDARPADKSPDALPGGRGESFNWDLLKDFNPPLPWMLAGGLNAGNVQEAIATLRPDAVDVSSGVEQAPGHKDPDKIREFIEAVRECR